MYTGYSPRSSDLAALKTRAQSDAAMLAERMMSLYQKMPAHTNFLIRDRIRMAAFELPRLVSIGCSAEDVEDLLMAAQTVAEAVEPIEQSWRLGYCSYGDIMPFRARTEKLGRSLTELINAIDPTVIPCEPTTGGNRNAEQQHS